MKRSLVADTAYSAITEVVEMVEMYGSVEDAIEVSNLLSAAKVRLDRIQGHPQGRPQR